jgi:integrative and conjugative element protein (TIGR02256 family)
LRAPVRKRSIVALAYGPGPQARHRPWSIAPDRPATQAAIDEVHNQSDGALSYIGEWHTHPGGSERPSRRDLSSIETIANEETVDLAEPLMLIVPTVIMRRRVRVRTVAAYRWRPETHSVGRRQITSRERDPKRDLARSIGAGERWHRRNFGS